jgi:phosphatidylserine decarboxylase
MHQKAESFHNPFRAVIQKGAFADLRSYELYVLFYCVELTPKVRTDLSDTLCIFPLITCLVVQLYISEPVALV